jgi:hypothetical protein
MIGMGAAVFLMPDSNMLLVTLAYLPALTVAYFCHIRGVTLYLLFACDDIVLFPSLRFVRG